jgi:MFS family permease
MTARPRLQRLTAFNFGIQLVWGAILAVSLQARCMVLTSVDAVQSYAFIAALGASIAAAVQILAGLASDWYVRRGGNRMLFYQTGTAATLPFLFWFYLAPSLAQFFAAFLGLQVAMNAASGPYQAAIPDHVPFDQHGTASSWVSVFQSLGAAAGLLLAGFVARPLVLAGLLAGGFAGSAAWSMLPCGVAGIQPLRGDPEPQFFSSSSLSSVLAMLVLSRGCINIGFYTLLGFLIFFVRDSLGVVTPAAQRMDAALIFLTFTLTGVFGAVAAARPADRYDKRRVILVANGVVMLGLLMLVVTNSLTIAWSAAALAGVGWGAFTVADWAIACAVLPRTARATATGIWNLASVTPQILAPLIAAPLILFGDRFGTGVGVRCAMLLAFLAFLLGTLWIQRIPLERRITS